MQGLQGGWLRSRVLQGYLLLHHQVDTLGGNSRVVQKSVQYRCRGAKRNVRDDRERLSGKLHLEGIFMDHEDIGLTRELFSQAQGPVRIVFHSHNPPGHPRELAGEHPSSGPELDHEVVLSHSGLCDYPACDPPVLEKVLAQLTPAPSPIVAPFLLTAPRIWLCMSPASSLHSSGSPFIFRMSLLHR